MLPKSIKCIRSIILLGLFICTSQFALAQNESTPEKDTSITKEVTPVELVSPSIEFLLRQFPDSIQLTAKTKAKINGTFYNLYAIKIVFSITTDSADIPIGFKITDRKGIATLMISKKEVALNDAGQMQFKASYGGNKSLEPVEETISFKKAFIELTATKADSLQTISVKLQEKGVDVNLPIAEATVGIYVKRSFLPLKIGELTTDADGFGSFEVPSGLPGDDLGNITFIASVEENETYGNIESRSVQKWGVPISTVEKELPRALWSSHPPIWMLVTFIILITLVWGHYIVIVYELFRLRKEEPKSTLEIIK